MRTIHVLPRSLVVLWFVFLGHSAARAEGPPKPSPEAAGLAPARLERIDSLIRDAVERRQIAGGVALLARHGKLGYLKAIGRQDIEANKPMAADTLFRIASMTKPVTSVAVMMLVEDGKVRLNDPVSKFIPEFKEMKVLVPGAAGAGNTLVPAQREITIHDLLTHTAGLTYRLWGQKPWCDLYREGGVSDGIVHREGTAGDNVRRLAKQPLMFQPGTAWGYGLSTDVLGCVVEAASGQNLATFFRERLFKPLKMEDTYFFVPPAKQGRLAALYMPGEGGKLVRVGDKPVTMGELVFSATYPLEKDGKYYSGGAGLVSTVGDYACFLQMLLGGGELDGARILKAETVKQMTSNQLGKLKVYIDDHGDCFGYGFGVVTPAGKGDVWSVGTFSWGGIFHTYFWVDPQKQLVGILMTQVYPYDKLSLRGEFRKRAYESLAD
jgi:CubicO group peptidase (beta-lactamase class C family)